MAKHLSGTVKEVLGKEKGLLLVLSPVKWIRIFWSGEIHQTKSHCMVKLRISDSNMQSALFLGLLLQLS